MRKLSPFNILVVYFFALAIIIVIANLTNDAPKGAKLRAGKPSPPRVSIKTVGETSATVEETVTYEIRITLNKETTATLVDVENQLNAFAGASLQVLDADPSFESTEAVPFGGGLKIKWGLFQMLGGDHLNIKLRLKSTQKGTIMGVASVKPASGELITSNNLMTMFHPAPLVEASTSVANSGASGLGLAPSQSGFGNAVSEYFRNKESTVWGRSGGTNGKSTLSEKPSTSVNAGGPSGKEAVAPPKGPESTASNKTKDESTEDKTARHGNYVSFLDVKKADWFSACVKDLVDKDVINGYRDFTFKPNNPISRAEFTVTVMRGAGIADWGDEPFDDVSKTDWFYPMVVAAYKLGVLDGVSPNKFASSNPITREEAVVIGIKAARLAVDTDTTMVDGLLKDFSDQHKISIWARPYVAASVKYKLLAGYPGSAFRPDAQITRAEACTLVHKLFISNQSIKSQSSNSTQTYEPVY